MCSSDLTQPGLEAKQIRPNNIPTMNFFSSAVKRILIGAGVGLSFGIPDALLTAAHSHGAHGGGSAQDLDPGEYRVRPVITIEGHGGFENNLVEEGKPQHYAIDGMFGVVFEWGLENGGSFSIEAQAGPALVYGEAEHFYGLVHDHGGEHEEHGEEEHAHGEEHAHEDEDDHEEHHDEDDHGDEEHGEENHGEEEEDDHDHEEDHDHEDHAHEEDHGHAHAEIGRAHV